MTDIENMTLLQRAIEGAKSVTLHAGRPEKDYADQEVSLDAAAAAYGVSKGTLVRARLIITAGTDEEKAALEAGTIGISPLADQIRARRREINPDRKRPGPKLGSKFPRGPNKHLEKIKSNQRRRWVEQLHGIEGACAALKRHAMPELDAETKATLLKLADRSRKELSAFISTLKSGE